MANFSGVLGYAHRLLSSDCTIAAGVYGRWRFIRFAATRAEPVQSLRFAVTHAEPMQSLYVLRRLAQSLRFIAPRAEPILRFARFIYFARFTHFAHFTYFVRFTHFIIKKHLNKYFLNL